MTDEPLKIAVDFKESAEVLTKYLGLEGSPVAFKFATKKEDIPAGMPEIDKVMRHCTMVMVARKENKAFYATADRHECNGGAWALGLKDITQTLKTGEFYFKLGKFASAPSCKRTIEHIPHLGLKETYATLYAPLENAPFVPQVVFIIASPRTMLKLAQATLFTLGGRIHAEFSGIQSVCADAAAQTYLTGHPNFSLGCDGSRRYSGIAEGEMVMGLPAEMLPELTAAIKVVVAAPGSK
ncbi:DUF169 domain-containing protein [Methanoregula sp. UBA64]|uniref:DUF169 domain-containing protein n=1 Tax=Methanoregula sp. UBA64 TaxID=1915554 RepID=UPI0025E02E55|nr:DUF169 domain-containing protein [Methanoregula sp. UBA64]